MATYIPDEQRKFERLNLICEAVAFVRSSETDRIMVARIVDLGPTGIGVLYFGEKWPLKMSLSLDIVLPGGEALLPELPGTIIWDSEAESEKPGLFPIRRCGIAFGDLSDVEKSYVQSLILHYSKGKGNP